MVDITKSQRAALEWFKDHGGGGAFVKGGATIIAQGEIAPFERKTWIALRDAGKIAMYMPENKKSLSRVKVIA